MYVVYYDNIAIASTEHPKFAMATAVITQAKNSADKFAFTLPATNPERDTPQIRMGIVTVRRDNELIFKGDVISTRLRFDGSREITCQGCLAWLNDVCNTRITVANTVSASFAARMTRYNSMCATKRQIQAGNCTNKPTATVKIFNPEAYNTIFDYFKLLLESKGGLMLPRYSGDDVFLDYLDTKGKTSSQEIYFGKNLLDLENYISAENTATVLFPTGQGGLVVTSVNPTGQPYIVNNPLYSRYGMIAQAAQYDAETAAELMSEATATLNALAVLNQTITLTAIDLSMLDSTVDSIEIGDNVHAVSAPHGLDTTLECSGKTIDLVNPANSTITLGKTLKSLSKIIAMGGIK